MPRCLMAKKWKGAALLEKSPPCSVSKEKSVLINTRRSDTLTDSSSFPSPSTGTINSQSHAWGPASPTEGATAPSPPPAWLPAPTAGKVTVLFNGYLQEPPGTRSTSPVSTEEPPQVTNMDNHRSSVIRSSASTRFRFGTCLPPPKKRDLYRPYCLPESIIAVQQEKLRLQTVCSSLFERKPEDLSTAHAILDLSTSSPLLPPVPPLTPATSVTITPLTSPPSLDHCLPSTGNNNKGMSAGGHSSSDSRSTQSTQPLATHNTNRREGDRDSRREKGASVTGTGRGNQSASGSTKTVSYTYEAFFVSDGRSKKKPSTTTPSSVETISHSPKENVADTMKLNSSNGLSGTDSDSSSTGGVKARYTCSECGKNYATSSNLSRHKQTHRSLDSQSAKRCPTCGKAYVSMPALAMHILTHNLHHKCEICGKAFSRPWLLQGHTRSHTGEKPYGCAHCGKAFADRSNLRAHMQTHSSAKNYTCKRCNKSFALKSYLNKHYDSACFKDGGSPSDADESMSASEMAGSPGGLELEEGEVLPVITEVTSLSS